MIAVKINKDSDVKFDDIVIARKKEDKSLYMITRVNKDIVFSNGYDNSSHCLGGSGIQTLSEFIDNLPEFDFFVIRNK